MRYLPCLPLVLPVPLLAIACAQPAPPVPAQPHPTVVEAPVPPPAAASSSASAAEAPRRPCIPAAYRAGWVSDLFDHESSAVYCLAISEKDQTCWRALPDGLAEHAPRSRSPVWPRLTSSGAHTIDSDAVAVKVCPAGSETPCSSVALKGFRGADPSEFPNEVAYHLPADANADGSRVLLVRHEGKRAEKVFVETYDLRNARRLGRHPIPADQYVTRVAWIGRLALLTICVEEGPGCSARLFDPDSGTSSPVALDGASINVYGIENPVQRAAGDSWAVVETNGSHVLFVNANTGKVETTVETGLAADVEAGVEVGRLSPDRIAIVSGAPRGGDLVVIDLPGRKVASRFSAPVCP